MGTFEAHRHRRSPSCCHVAWWVTGGEHTLKQLKCKFATKPYVWTPCLLQAAWHTVSWGATLVVLHERKDDRNAEKVWCCSATSRKDLTHACRNSTLVPWISLALRNPYALPRSASRLAWCTPPSVAPITPCFRLPRSRWNRRGSAVRPGVIPVCRRPSRRSSFIGVSGMPRCSVTTCLPPSWCGRRRIMAGQG